MISIPAWLFVILCIPYGLLLVLLIIILVQSIVMSRQEKKQEQHYEVIGKGVDEDNGR